MNKMYQHRLKNVSKEYTYNNAIYKVTYSLVENSTDYIIYEHHTLITMQHTWTDRSVVYKTNEYVTALVEFDRLLKLSIKEQIVQN